ncbi:MAG: YbjP/YqhG family protein [Methylobacillus sp.]|nr:YbjP/YqhG family protein [Methylobacillus sp.]
MFTKRNFLFLIAALLFAAPLAANAAPPPSDDPVAIVNAIYARAVAGKSGGGGWFVFENKTARAKYLSKSLNALWDKSEKLVEKGDIGAIDFDPVTNGQDSDIKSFKVVTEKTEADKTIVAATFVGLYSSSKTTVHYVMVREAGGWKIDEMYERDNKGDEGWSLRELHTDFIKMMQEHK